MSNEKVKTFWNERWALVETKAPTRENIYYVSNYGKLKSVNKQTGAEKLLKGSPGVQGYRLLNLKLKDNIRQGFYVHKLVGKYFLPAPSEDQKFLVHLDQNKKNNHVNNLKWITRAELSQRWKDLGVYDHVDKTVLAHVKMTESKVRLLKERLKKGKTKKRILARQFNISVTQVNRIISGENWGHVK